LPWPLDGYHVSQVNPISLGLRVCFRNLEKPKICRISRPVILCPFRARVSHLILLLQVSTFLKPAVPLSFQSNHVVICICFVLGNRNKDFSVIPITDWYP